MASVRTMEEEEIRKICEIVWAPKVLDIETDKIMGSIGYVFLGREITEQIVARINVRYMKVNAVESKTIHSVIAPE